MADNMLFTGTGTYMKAKWLAMTLLICGSLLAAGCAGTYRTGYREPRLGPGYSRYDPRISDRDHRGDYGRDYHRQNERRHRGR